MRNLRMLLVAATPILKLTARREARARGGPLPAGRATVNPTSHAVSIASLAKRSSRRRSVVGTIPCTRLPPQTPRRHPLTALARAEVATLPRILPVTLLEILHRHLVIVVVTRRRVSEAITTTSASRIASTSAKSVASAVTIVVAIPHRLHQSRGTLARHLVPLIRPAPRVQMIVEDAVTVVATVTAMMGVDTGTEMMDAAIVTEMIVGIGMGAGMLGEVEGMKRNREDSDAQSFPVISWTVMTVSAVVANTTMMNVNHLI